MQKITLVIFLLLSAFHVGEIAAQTSSGAKIDVLSYHVYLEPNLSEKYLQGHVTITFKTDVKADKVIFDSGDLRVRKLVGEHTIGFEQKDHKTIISLAQSDTEIHKIQLFYDGNPKKGLVFLDTPPSVYSVYFTDEWMICNAVPDDKATLKLEALISENLTCVASGMLMDTLCIGNKIKYSWSQEYEAPTYTYGFAIAPFTHYEQRYGDKNFAYYTFEYSREEIETIFQYSGDILSFFEKKSGISFPQKTYAQILIGYHYQEMSGFAVLKASYGELVLKDSTETNLISHELAHQWWGNMITCKNWNHFWLNEGFATFMSAVYNEHRFGEEKYKQDIDSFFRVYTNIKSKGADKPLVFDSWTNPSQEDRNLIYFKGAYVLHLLRRELGEKSFWKGIKYFSQKYYGKSVTTQMFQIAMESSSGKSLEVFFNKWVY